MKKILALVLSIAIVFSFLPVFAVSAAGEFAYAETLNVSVGETIFTYDFSTDSAPKSATEGDHGNTWVQTSTALGKRALYFQYSDWSDEGRKAAFVVGQKDFAARVTVAVDNSISNNQSGTFRVYTASSNGSASYMQIGLPDRTAGDPYPGAVTVYNAGAQYGFDLYGGVTPFTKSSGVETFTFEIYSLNGVNYYCKEDGTLIGFATQKSGVKLDDTTFIKFTCGYGEAWITDITVKALGGGSEQPPAQTNAFNYAETLNAKIGDEVINYDFSKDSLSISKDSTPVSGTTWISTSSALGKKALYFTYDNIDGNRWANFKVGKENFAARITVAVDNGIASNQSGTFVISSVGNGGTASYMKIGLPDRTAGDPYPGSVIIYNEGAQYGFDIYGKATPFITSSTVATFTVEVYNYNGVSYYCKEDGTLIGKSNHKSGVTLNETSSIKLSHGYGEVWVTDIVIVELDEESAVTPDTPQDPEKPVSTIPYSYANNLDLVVGDDILSYDFSKDSLSIDKNTTPVSGTTWIQNSTALGKKALYFTYDTSDGNRYASFKVGKADFVARITMAVDNNAANNQAGTFRAITTGANNVSASYIQIGLPDRTAGDPRPGAVAIYNEAEKYGFDLYGSITPFTTKSTIETYTFEVYNYNGITYYCQADGTLIGKSVHKSGVVLDETTTLKLNHGYGEVWVTDITIKELSPCRFGIDSAALALKNDQSFINFTATFDNSLKDIQYDENTEFGAVVTFDDTSDLTTDTTVETEGAVIWEFEKVATEDDIVKFTKEMAVTSDILDKFVNVKLFVKNGDSYIYSPAVSYCPAKLADLFYRSTLNEAEKQAVEEIFAGSALFHGEGSKRLTFTVFSDFHYKQGMYVSSIADMNSIFERAYETGSSFVLSGGDMCNDFSGSPELVNAFKNNKYGITAANVYGNHELESAGNSMEVVTNTLTNAENVVWGTADGSYNASIGYYYFESEGFRIICTDTNYSYNPNTGAWEHNKESSYGSPSGNQYACSLGPVQLAWLEEVLTDAAEKDIPCIVASHAVFYNWDDNCPDYVKVQSIFEKVNTLNPGTVMMQISGHAHDDKITVYKDVVYFRVNTTRNTAWSETASNAYGEDDYFMMETYDAQGNFLGYEKKLISSLSGGKNTYFSASPVSAVVTIDECGIICIDGADVGWLNGVARPDSATANADERPEIRNYSNFNCETGHIWAEDFTVAGDVHYKECINPDCTIKNVEENAYYGEHEFTNGECVCGESEAETFAKGDVNGDGNVDAADLALIKKVIAKLTPIDDPSVKQPDVDGEGTTPDAADLALLKKIIAKLV